MKFDKIIPHCKRGSCMPKPEKKPDVVHVLQRIVCPCDIDTMAPGKSLAEIAPLCGTWTIAKSDGIPQGILLMSVNSDRSKVIQTKYDTDVIDGSPAFYSRSADVYKSICGGWSEWQRTGIGGDVDGDIIAKLMDEAEKAIANSKDAKDSADSAKAIAEDAKAIAEDAASDASGARSLADKTAQKFVELKGQVGDPAGLATGMGAENIVGAVNWLYDNRGTGAGSTPGGAVTVIPADVARTGYVDSKFAEAKEYTDETATALGNAINIQAQSVKDISNNLAYTKGIAESTKALAESTKALAEANKAAIDEGFNGYNTITENDGGTSIEIYKEIEGNNYSSGAVFTYDTVSLSNGCSNRNHTGYINEMTLNSEGIYVSTSGKYDIQAKGGFTVNDKSVATADDVDAAKASIKTFGKIYGDNNVAVEAAAGGKEVSIVGSTKFGTKTTAAKDSIVVEGVAIADGMQCGMMSIADKKKLDAINVTELSIGPNGVLVINGTQYQLTPVSSGETQEPTIVRQYAETPVVIVSYQKAPAEGGIIDKGVLNYYQNYVTVWSNGKTETERRTAGGVVTYAFEPSGDYAEGAENGTVLVRANETSVERIVGVMTVTVTMDGVSGESKVTIRQAAAAAAKEIYYGSIGDGSGNMSLVEARALAEEETSASLKNKLTSTANTSFSGNWNRTAFFVMVKKGAYSNIVINSVSSIGTTQYSTAKGNVRKSSSSDASYDIYYAIFTGATDSNNPTANVIIS